MNDRNLKTLGDYITVKHGFAFKGKFFADGPTDDVLVTPGNFAIGGGFKDDKLKHYSGPVPEEYVLKEGDLVITMTDLSKAGDTLGYPALIPQSAGRRYLHNQRIGLVQIDDQADADTRFLFYRLCASDYRHHVLSTASGSTVRHTSPSRIYEFATILPPLDEQRAIASVLGALDDKIEQNRRTAQALEQLARAIFRAWFVDFEPVKAKAAGATSFPAMPNQVFEALPSEIYSCPSGSAPSGWTLEPLDQAIKVNPARRLQRGTIAPYLPMSQIPTTTHVADGWSMREVGTGSKFTNGDTLVARITPCLENGKTAFVDFLKQGEVAWGSTEYIVLRPNQPIPPVWAYLLARTSEFRTFSIRSMSGTSGRQRVPYDALSKFNVAVAPASIMEAFAEIVEPVLARSSAAIRESKKLVEMRDLMLPRLLSERILPAEYAGPSK